MNLTRDPIFFSNAESGSSFLASCGLFCQQRPLRNGCDFGFCHWEPSVHICGQMADTIGLLDRGQTILWGGVLRVILLAALSRVCERAAMTIRAWVLARPK